MAVALDELQRVVDAILVTASGITEVHNSLYYTPNLNSVKIYSGTTRDSLYSPRKPNTTGTPIPKTPALLSKSGCLTSTRGHGEDVRSKNSTTSGIFVPGTGKRLQWIVPDVLAAPWWRGV